MEDADARVADVGTAVIEVARAAEKKGAPEKVQELEDAKEQTEKDLREIFESVGGVQM